MKGCKQIQGGKLFHGLEEMYLSFIIGIKGYKHANSSTKQHMDTSS